MHIFDYQEIPSTLLIPEIVNMLSALHEFKGKQELYIETEPDVLTALLDIARIQSTKASNKIEGIYTSDERLEALVMEKAEPRNRSEEEIAGYREVLATIHESYEYIMVRPDISETTIERTLKELLEAGYIEKVGKARATGYVRKEHAAH